MSKARPELVGYLAQASPWSVCCDGDACVIAGSATQLKTYLQMTTPGTAAQFRVRKAWWADVLAGLRLGAAYALDAAAYRRFYPLAQRAGLPVQPEDFSTPPPAGMTGPAVHLVRVQILR